jgi:hypothetical protein
LGLGWYCTHGGEAGHRNKASLPDTGHPSAPMHLRSAFAGRTAGITATMEKNFAGSPTATLGSCTQFARLVR